MDSTRAEFDWCPQPAAAALIGRLVDSFRTRQPRIAALAAAMRDQTGTRLVDWVDHFVLPSLPDGDGDWQRAGFAMTSSGDDTLLTHPGGLFPTVVLDDRRPPRLAIKVESVVDFLAACGEADANRIQGGPFAPLRTAVIDGNRDGQLWAIERHGSRAFEADKRLPERPSAVQRHYESFRLRQRDFPTAGEGFAHAVKLIDAAHRDLPVGQTSALFFAAERAFWQRRNSAARVQRARQDRLGLGWANHDHHTYRSSRTCFADLIAVLERLGFRCRERFYGGREAGWGAQVLEQEDSGIVIFADVDLTPEEVTGDFAHQGLDRRDRLGTVGLWCKLHGEAFLQAGMHHLECQFDFAAARRQLARAGVPTMKPFTDFPHLKQAFTVGERWPVDDARLAATQREAGLSGDDIERFRQQGCLGSHLEILERNDGYKGFNQTGISEIIRETDPREQAP